MSDISKACADALRLQFSSLTIHKIKSSHARELVAAYFGYRSHAALLCDDKYPVDGLIDAAVLIPSVQLLDERRQRLSGLPSDMPSSNEIARVLSAFLVDHRLFKGKLWLYESLEGYVTDVFMPEKDWQILDQLSGLMAETNTFFDEAYYESAEVNEFDDEIVVNVVGQLSGESNEDKPFCGDRIDMEIEVRLYRAAGRVAFLEPDISAGGAIDESWVDPDIWDGPSTPAV